MCRFDLLAMPLTLAVLALYRNNTRQIRVNAIFFVAHLIFRIRNITAACA